MTTRNSKTKSVGRGDPLLQNSKKDGGDMTKEQFLVKQNYRGKPMKNSEDRKPSAVGIHNNINLSKEKITNKNPRLKGQNLLIRDPSNATATATGIRTAGNDSNTVTKITQQDNTSDKKKTAKAKEPLKEEIFHPTFEIEPRFKFVNKNPDFFNDKPYHPITRHIDAPGENGTF